MRLRSSASARLNQSVDRIAVEPKLPRADVHGARLQVRTPTPC